MKILQENSCIIIINDVTLLTEKHVKLSPQNTSLNDTDSCEARRPSRGL